MSTATVSSDAMTAEDFFAWAARPANAGRRCELDAGRIVDVPPPNERHGTVCWLASRILGDYLFGRGLGSLALNDTGLIVARDPDTVRGPDIIVTLARRDYDQLSGGPVEAVPPLVVEVVSPSDSTNRINRRIAQYHGRGVALVWLIDPVERTVGVYKPNEIPKVLDDTDTLTGNGVLPDFSCTVADFFTLPGGRPAAE